MSLTRRKMPEQVRRDLEEMRQRNERRLQEQAWEDSWTSDDQRQLRQMAIEAGHRRDMEIVRNNRDEVLALLVKKFPTVRDMLQYQVIAHLTTHDTLHADDLYSFLPMLQDILGGEDLDDDDVLTERRNISRSWSAAWKEIISSGVIEPIRITVRGIDTELTLKSSHGGGGYSPVYERGYMFPKNL